MKGKLSFLLLLTVLFFNAKNSFSKTIKSGEWLLELSIKKDKILPVNVTINQSKKGILLSFINGNETIIAKDCRLKNDSLFVQMPIFNSCFLLKINDKKSISGVWCNLAKGPDYKIPVQLTAKVEDRFQQGKEKTFSADGKWKVVFNSNSEHPWDALGIFSSDKDILEGTFLTETGDYRFLQGNIVENKLQVSCFDGSHAFLFEAEFNNDTLKGNFYSGNHWSCDWFAIKDESFELRNPEELTHIKDNYVFTFAALDSLGNTFSYPNEDYKDKVTIIQIMGSWCPNCMDETVFYKELYKDYNAQGLEIISVGFEVGKTNEIRQKQLARLKKHFDINYPVLLGGKADKKVANEVFSSLNHVMSFPTSIFLDKQGKVRKIHTGFNGPSTGSYYTNYVEQTKMLIEELIND